jgi:hypothetical protein
MLDTKVLGVVNKILWWNKKHLDNPEIEKKIQGHPGLRPFLNKDDLITSGSRKIDEAIKHRTTIVKQALKKLGSRGEESFLDLIVNLTSQIDSQETVIGKLRVAKGAIDKREAGEPTTARK